MPLAHAFFNLDNAVDMLALQGELVTRLKLMADARSQIIPKIEKRQALVEVPFVMISVRFIAF